MLLPPSQWVDLGNPLTAHWLNARLQARYLVLPGLTSPSRWPNLVAPTLRTALPTNMAAALSATSGLSFVTTRRGGQGQWNYDGSDDRHAATQSWTLQDWTVSCWFRSGDTSNQKGMVCLTDTTWSTNSNPAGVFLILNGQALQIGLRLANSGSFEGASAGTIPINVWHQAVFSRRGTSCVGYVDGEVMTTFTASAATAITLPAVPLGIGAFWGGSVGWTGFYTGALDDVALHAYGMSLADVRAWYQETANGSPLTVRRGARRRLPLPIASAGEVVSTQEAQTLASQASTGATGEASLTQADQTLSSTGTLALQGSASLTQDAQMFSAVGGLEIAGAAILTQADQTLNSTLYGGASLLATQADQTLSSTAVLALTGTLTSTQAAQTLSSTGLFPQAGNLMQTLAGNTLASAGVHQGLSATLTQAQAGNTLVARGLRPTPTAAWLTAAGHGATLAGLSWSYSPVMRLRFPQLGRTFATVTDGDAELLIADLRQGGIGTITRDLDDTTGEARLGQLSCALVNTEGLNQTITALQHQPIVADIGFVGLTERLILFTGVVDRYEIMQETIRLSAIPTTLRNQTPVSMTIRELIAQVTQETGSNPFPDIPDDSLNVTLPLYLGQLLSVPFFPVGNHAYLSGFGVAQLNSVRDNNEALITRDRIPFLAYHLPVGEKDVTVLQVQYDVEAGHVITADLNNPDDPIQQTYVGTWTGSSPPHFASPRPRLNLLAAPGLGDFDGTSTPLWVESGTGAAVTIVYFGAGSGHVHSGQASLSVTSDNSNPSDHRFSVTLSLPGTISQPESSSFVLSFWYSAGIFGGSASALSIQLSGGEWIPLPATPSPDTLREYTAHFVALDGVLDIQLKCEGLSTVDSGQLYLDAFVCYGEDGVHPFVDNGVSAVEAIRALNGQIPTLIMDEGSLETLDGQRTNWRLRSLLTPGANLDPQFVMKNLVLQSQASLVRDAQDVAHVLAKEGTGSPTYTFTEAANIVEGTMQRVSRPADAQPTSFKATASAAGPHVYPVQTPYNGIVYLETPTLQAPKIENGVVFLNATSTNLDHPALTASAQALVDARGGDKTQQVPADLLLDNFTTKAAVTSALAQQTLFTDLLQWQTWLDALPVQLGDMVSVQHTILPSGGTVDAKVTGWHFSPSTMLLELVAKALSDATPPDAPVQHRGPVAHPITLATVAGVPVGESLPLHVTPAPNTTLNVASGLVSDPGAAGSIAVSLVGVAVFTPTGMFVGLVHLTYTMADTDGNVSNTSTITITVGDPVQFVFANPDEASTTENIPVVIAVLDNDAVVAPGTIDITSVDLDPDTPGQQTTFEDTGHGTFAVDGSGVVTFTPDVGYTGDALASYTIQDDSGHTALPATITVHVTPAIPLAWHFSYTTSADPSASGALGFGLLGGQGYFGAGYLQWQIWRASAAAHTVVFDGAGGAVSAIYDDAETWLAGFESSVGVGGPTEIDFSTDSGATWDFATTDATQRVVWCIVPFAGAIYVGQEAVSGSGPILSTWETGTFTTVQTWDASYSAVRQLVEFGGVLYAGLSRSGSDGAEVWSSPDGSTWDVAHTFPAGVSQCADLCVHAGALYAAVYTVGSTRSIYRTTDGDIWTLVESLPTHADGVMSRMASDGSNLIVGVGVTPAASTSDARIYAYDGLTWALAVDFNDTPFSDTRRSVTAVGFVPGSGKLYACVGTFADDGSGTAHIYVSPTAD